MAVKIWLHHCSGAHKCSWLLVVGNNAWGSGWSSDDWAVEGGVGGDSWLLKESGGTMIVLEYNNGWVALEGELGWNGWVLKRMLSWLEVDSVGRTFSLEDRFCRVFDDSFDSFFTFSWTSISFSYTCLFMTFLNSSNSSHSLCRTNTVCTVHRAATALTDNTE